MTEIYRSRNKADYCTKVSLLQRLKPEAVLHTPSLDREAEYCVYHLSNGVTLLKMVTHYHDGDEYQMMAYGKRRGVRKVRRIVRGHVPKNR